MPYTPTTWTTGLPITIARLNNIESGIQAAPNNAVSTAAIVANAVSKITTATDTANRNSTSTTYVDSGAALTFTVDVASSPVMFTATGRTLLSGGANECYIAYSVDGGADVLAWSLLHANNDTRSFAIILPITGLSAGSHTIKLRIKNDSGVTFSIRGDLLPTVLTAIEYKR